MLNEKIFIVIPAFNESSRLGTVLQHLHHEYPNLVVIDDGSSDNTAEVGRRFGGRVLRHIINRGQGAALQTGILFSLRQGAKWIVTFDADGQHQASDIPNMLAPIFQGIADITLGSRFIGGMSNTPLLRRCILMAARLFTRFVSGVRLTDCHNGFRALSRQAAEHINLRQDRMAHASEFYDQMKLTKLPYYEVPVSIIYSKETLAKGQSVFNSISILFQYFFRRFSK